MSEPSPPGKGSYDDPAIYRIVVGGVLDEAWADRLVGMTITVDDSGGGRSRTTLQGRISDQAELNSLLDKLYGLHLPVLAVSQLENDE